MGIAKPGNSTVTQTAWGDPAERARKEPAQGNGRSECGTMVAVKSTARRARRVAR